MKPTPPGITYEFIFEPDKERMMQALTAIHEYVPEKAPVVELHPAKKSGEEDGHEGRSEQVAS